MKYDGVTPPSVIAYFLGDRPKLCHLSKVLSRLHQGPVLDPMLMIIFMNDMELCVKHLKSDFLLTTKASV